MKKFTILALPSAGLTDKASMLLVGKRLIAKVVAYKEWLKANRTLSTAQIMKTAVYFILCVRFSVATSHPPFFAPLEPRI